MRGMKQVFVTRLTDVDSTDKEGIGSLRQEGNSWYKYCKIYNDTATVTGVAGTLVAYDATTGYGNNVVVIDLSDADTVPLAAGALCGTCAGTVDTAFYGWVQIKGPTTLDTAVTSGAAGKGFTLTTTDKTATVAVTGDVSPYAGVSVNSTTGVVLDCQF